MGRPEGVVDEDVGIRRQGRGEGRIVVLLRGMEPQVFQHEHFARTKAPDRILRAHAQRIAGDRDVATQQLGQALTDGAKAEPVLDLAVRSAQVADQDDPGTGLEQGRDGGDGSPDPRVVGHPAIGQRDVEIDPDEDPLAGDVGVANGQLVHAGALTAAVSRVAT